MIYKPLVSVVMNCLNGEQFISKAIESVFAQTYSNWEIIFLDNASTDHSIEIAQSFGDRVRCFKNERTVPLGEARNQALKKVKGELVAFLDVDDIWFPDKLTRQVPLFEGRPEIGIVYSDTDLLNEDRACSELYFKVHQCKPLRGYIFESLLKHYAIPMLTTVVRIEVLQKMPQWFDSSYQVCDDFDFFMRVCYDWEVDYVNTSLASCLIHSAATTVRMHRFAPSEMAKTLEKLRSTHEDFDERFGLSATKLSEQITYKQGVSYWRDGLGPQARREFAKYLTKKKYLYTYVASYFPFSLIERARNFYYNMASSIFS